MTEHWLQTSLLEAAKLASSCFLALSESRETPHTIAGAAKFPPQSLILCCRTTRVRTQIVGCMQCYSVRLHSLWYNTVAIATAVLTFIHCTFSPRAIVLWGFDASSSQSSLLLFLCVHVNRKVFSRLLLLLLLLLR